MNKYLQQELNHSHDSIVYNLERGNIESFDQVKYLNNVGND